MQALKKPNKRFNTLEYFCNLYKYNAPKSLKLLCAQNIYKVGAKQGV